MPSGCLTSRGCAPDSCFGGSAGWFLEIVLFLYNCVISKKEKPKNKNLSALAPSAHSSGAMLGVFKKLVVEMFDLSHEPAEEGSHRGSLTVTI